MTIKLDGYRVNRTQTLEDFTSDLSASIGSTAEQVWTENPVSSLFRQGELDNARYGGFAPGAKGAQFKGPETPIISKIDADKRVTEAGVKLEIGARGLPEGALDILIDRKREEVKRKAIIAAAPEGFWSGAAQIGVGLAVSMADPINIASAFVPIVGQARYAKLLANASSSAGRASVRAGVGVVEGAVGAAIVEPIVLYAAKSEQADYGLYDSFLNLTFGAVLGGGLHAGLGAVGDAIGRSRAQVKEDLLRSAVGQSMDNKPIDVGFVAKTDPSFREEWRASQVDGVIKGADVDVRVRREFNRAMDELRPELITRAEAMPDNVSAKVIEDLEAGRVPEVFVDDIAKVVKSRIDDFDAPAPKVDAMSPEASPESAAEAQITVDQAIDETPDSIQSITDDILTALDEQAVDTSVVRAEIVEINQSAEREAAGLREAVACKLGL